MRGDDSRHHSDAPSRFTRTGTGGLVTLHRNTSLLRQPLAFGATIALALTGVFASTPALANEADRSVVAQLAEAETAPDTELAPGEEAVPEAEAAPDADSAPPSAAEVEAFEEAGVDLVGVGVNALGDTVVVITGGDIDTPAGQTALDELASSRGNAEEITTIQLQRPVEAVAAQDLVGGAGYIAANTVTGDGGYCSLGFAAWSPSREPAFITAGHCMNGSDENIALAGIPDEEPAVGGPGTIPSSNLPLIGKFGFAQYGGVGGTVGAYEDPNSIDIAVIDVAPKEDWTLKPEVTDWTTAGPTPGSLAGSTTKVEQVGLPQLGPIARSGRSTGYEVGTVRQKDILDGWILVSNRWVHGFSSATVAIPGDSGGSVVQGTTAVGVVSGSAPDVWGEPFLWSSLLQEALPATGGYEVALDIAAPEIEATRVTMGDNIAVTVPDNATGLTVVEGGTETTITPVNGVATVPAPTVGNYSYTLTAMNGMSRSEPTVGTVAVAPPAPGVTSITNGQTFTDGSAPTTISGTGMEGATVDIMLTTPNNAQPDARYTATVQNGTWSVNLEPWGSAMVEMRLDATQTSTGVTSATTTLDFTVYGQHQPTPPTVKPTGTLANTGGQGLAPLGIAAGAALLLGGGVLTAAAIRRKARAKR